MSVSRIAGSMSAALCAGMVLMAVSCGKMPGPTGPQTAGAIEVQIQMSNGLAKRTGQLKTAFDSLVIEVSGDDMQTMRFVHIIDEERGVIIDTVSGIPAGSERRISVKTVNVNGETVHEDSLGVRTIRIDPNFTTCIQVVLVPVKGSIYLQVGGVPTDIDSMGAIFVSEDGQVWQVTVARKPKVYLSIDNIPHATSGTLTVAGFTAQGDTLYSASSEVTVDARSTTGIELSFDSTPGGVVFEGTLELPGAVTVAGSINGSDVAATESGELIITEIMYAANDSEYVEVYNPGDNTASFDTLYLEIDGTRRLFTDISVDAKSYFVFGRKALPWVDVAHSTASALDLSSNGNWLTLLSSSMTVLDQVVFTGGTNSLEWPKVSGKCSICLKSDAFNPEDNNYGRNWKAASETIEGAPSQSGTPHSI